jgi:hypothetical protein
MLSSRDILINIISVRDTDTITFRELSEILGLQGKDYYSTTDKANLLSLVKERSE